jgi:ABC-type transport system involved in multi-copper enzyme maturation permease subunit
MLLSQIGLIARFELVRNFLTRRGMLSIGVFVLAWYVMLRYPITAASDFLLKGDQQGFQGFLLQKLGLQEMVSWPVAELAVYWQLALYIFPLLALSVSADQTASDCSRGTMRYLTLHCSRSAVFLGRYVGQMCLFGVLLSVTLLSVVTLVYLRDENLLGSALHLVITVWAGVMLNIAPFVALMALFSAMVTTPKQATMLALLVLMLAYGLLRVLTPSIPQLQLLAYVIPGVQFSELRALALKDLFTLWLVPVCQAVGLLGLGLWVLKRKSL